MALRLVILAALLTAVTAVCSLISLPNPLVGVPFTLQVFAVCLAGAVLPPRWAFASLAVYLLLGTIGLPVFAGASAGPAELVSVSGGFLWGFPFAAAACSAIAGPRPRYLRLVLAEIAGIAVVYAFGFGGLVVFGHLPATPGTALTLGSFLPWDLLKAVIAASVALRVRTALASTGSVPAAGL